MDHTKGGGGGKSSEALGQQLAATPPYTGKICTAVLRLERPSRCTAPYARSITLQGKDRKKRGYSWVAEVKKNKQT